VATVTTSGPQEQVAMPSVDLRRMVGGLITAEGVSAVNDLKATQRAAGANMSVDVAAGHAYIKDDHANGGGYYSADWTVLENIAIAAAHASLPRIDRIVLRVYDAYLGDAQNKIQLEVVQGTPTSGATLVNLNGAGVVPGSALLVANVLVGAAAVSVVNANIDTGTTVRLQTSVIAAASALTELAYTEFTAPVTVTNTTEGAADTLVTAPAITLDGTTTILIEFGCWKVTAAAAGQVFLVLYQDGSSIGRMIRVQFPATTTDMGIFCQRRMIPAAGSRTYSIRAYRATANFTFEGAAGGVGNGFPGYIRLTKAN
jgi:hypothetical protein